MATSFTTMWPFWSSRSDASRPHAGNPGRRCAAFQENAGTIPADVAVRPSKKTLAPSPRIVKPDRPESGTNIGCLEKAAKALAPPKTYFK
jgi:hypothetical protein